MNSPFADLDSYILKPDQRAQAQALADALRSDGGQMLNSTQQPGAQQGQQPQQGVVNANAQMPSMQQMMPAMQGMGAGLNNLYTAGQYGTNPFSQQTGMLAAQEAGMGFL